LNVQSQHLFFLTAHIYHLQTYNSHQEYQQMVVDIIEMPSAQALFSTDL
jgi:hypothetical protein